MTQLKEKIINNKLVEKLLLIFLMIQPLLDFAFLFKEKVVNLFGFSPSTIIRILGIGIIVLLFLLTNKNKKEYKYLFIYGFLVLVYTVFHHLHALNFTDYYNGYNFGYTLFSEIFYIIRMLLPLSLIYISAHYKFDNKEIEKLLTILIILICGSILLTNLTKIALGSYSKETIKGSILCWFKSDRCGLSYFDLASKGFFNDPNRLASLLTLITSLTYYILITNPSLKNKILIILLMLGMFILGTKVSTYGFALLTILAFLLYLFFSFIKKELKFQKSLSIFFIFIIICLGILIPISPALNRTEMEQENISNFEELNAAALRKSMRELEEKIANNPEEASALKKDYIKKYYEDYHINPQFIIDSYSYEYDPDFWLEIMKKPMVKRTDFRLIEELMLKRVKEINNQKLDDYLGITFTRMSNIFDLERDFISHYYTMGIFGFILLVFPYLLITLICIVKILINFKKCATPKNAFYLMGIGIALGAAFYSGNVLDGLIVTLILGFVIGALVNNLFAKKED